MIALTATFSIRSSHLIALTSHSLTFASLLTSLSPHFWNNSDTLICLFTVVPYLILSYYHFIFSPHYSTTSTSAVGASQAKLITLSYYLITLFSYQYEHHAIHLEWAPHLTDMAESLSTATWASLPSESEQISSQFEALEQHALLTNQWLGCLNNLMNDILLVLNTSQEKSCPITSSKPVKKTTTTSLHYLCLSAFTPTSARKRFTFEPQIGWNDGYNNYNNGYDMKGLNERCVDDRKNEEHEYY